MPGVAVRGEGGVTGEEKLFLVPKFRSCMGYKLHHDTN